MDFIFRIYNIVMNRAKGEIKKTNIFQSFYIVLTSPLEQEEAVQKVDRKIRLNLFRSLFGNQTLSV